MTRSAQVVAPASPARHRVSLAPDLRTLATLLLVSLALWTLAYQAPSQLHLAVGGDRETERREDDAPFLAGFHASEPSLRGRFDWWNLEPGYTYRWTRPDAAIDVPGIGAGRWTITLLASSGRPDGGATTSTWQTDAHALNVPVSANPRVYHILADADHTGDLHLQLSTPPFDSPGDPRDLGFVVQAVSIGSTPGGLRLPALPQLGSLVLVLALVYGLARWLVLDRRAAALSGLALAMTAAVLLATHRFALTLWTPNLVSLALACWGLALLVQGVAFLNARRTGQRRQAHRERNIALALVLLAFALRMGGMLHPHAIFSDHRLNANNLLEFGIGAVYFTEGLPAESGGGQAPYPPGVYLLLAPLQLLLPADIDGRVLVVQSGVALLDSLVVLLLWLLIRQAGFGRRAALFGAALYLLPPPLLTSFSVGEYANIGGQALALPAIALLAWNVASTPHSSTTDVRGYQSIGLWGPLLCVGLLGHLGVSISLGLLLVSAWLWGVRGRYFALRSLTLGGLLALAGVGALYYSAPTFASFFAERLVGAGGDDTATASFVATVVAIGRDLVAPYHRLPGLLVVGGVGGLVIISYRGRGWVRQRGMAAMLSAWWLGTLFAIGLPLVVGASQGVRWPHFLYPALCLGAGPVLAALWRRGISGRVVALFVLLSIISYGFIIWITQIRNYLHL